MAEQRDGDLHHPVAGACLFQKRAEQDEEKDEARRHAKCNAEHAFGCQPLMVEKLGERCAAMLNHVRHVLAGKGVEDEDTRHDHHRQAERTARRLEQQQDANGAGHQIERGRLARPSGKHDVKEKEVGAGKSADHGQHPVEQWHAIAGRGT
jgi:hypothetical protein